MDNPNRQVTLKLDGNKITSERFLHAVQAFVGVVNEVTMDVTGKRKAIDWVVEVREGSLEVIMTAEARKLEDEHFVPPVLTALRGGAASLETSNEIPPHFNETALVNLKDLASVVDEKQTFVSTVDLLFDGQRVRVSRHATANVEDILGAHFSSIGTIEGRLMMVTARGGHKFAVYDDLTDRRVECTFKAEMLEEVKAAFEHRVAVFGLVNYRKTGEPINVKVQRFMVLDQKGLPGWADVRGILEG